LVAVAFVLAAVAWPVDRVSGAGRERVDPTIRNLTGIVLDPDGNPLAGAVVQLKNMKSLQVRSFITQEDGGYSFPGLSKDIDYEVRADFKGGTSPVRKLTIYDTRTKPNINLTVEPNKQP
jgi:hypothetical protein